MECKFNEGISGQAEAYSAVKVEPEGVVVDGESGCKTFGGKPEGEKDEVPLQESCSSEIDVETKVTNVASDKKLDTNIDTESDQGNFNSTQNKRIRKPNFTHEEVAALLKEVDKYKHVVVKPEGLAKKHVWEQKRLHWKQITNEVNKHTEQGVCRTVDEVIVKWKGLKKAVAGKRKGTISSKAHMTDPGKVYYSQVRKIMESTTGKKLGSRINHADEAILDKMGYDMYDSDSTEAVDSSDLLTQDNSCTDEGLNIPWANSHRKRDRKPNFSHVEIMALLKEVHRHKHVILKREASGHHNLSQQKQQRWKLIAAQVNMSSQTGIHRTAFEVREKWRHIKAVTLNRRPITETSSIAQAVCRDVYSKQALQILESRIEDATSTREEDLQVLEQSGMLYAEEGMSGNHKRHRKPNFSNKEIAALLGEVRQRRVALLHFQSNRLNASQISLMRRHQWQLVADQVNQSSQDGVNRTEDEVKEKWKSLRLAALTEQKAYTDAAENGEPLPELSPHTKEVLEILDTSGLDLTVSPEIVDLEDSWSSVEIPVVQRVKKHRKPNFSRAEVTTLLREMRKRRAALIQSERSRTSQMSRARRLHWRLVTHHVNKSSRKGIHRTLQEVRFKWNHLRKVAVVERKAFLEAAKRGQSLPKLSLHTKEVLEIIDTARVNTSRESLDFEGSLSSASESHDFPSTDLRISLSGCSAVRSASESQGFQSDVSNQSEQSRRRSLETTTCLSGSDSCEAVNSFIAGHQLSQPGEKPKRERKANMTLEQIDWLLKGLEEYQSLLLISYPEKMFSEERDSAWKTIRERVNKCGGVQWTVEELKSSWYGRRKVVNKYVKALSCGEGKGMAVPLFFDRILKILQTTGIMEGGDSGISHALEEGRSGCETNFSDEAECELADANLQAHNGAVSLSGEEAHLTDSEDGREVHFAHAGQLLLSAETNPETKSLEPRGSVKTEHATGSKQDPAIDDLLQPDSVSHMIKQECAASENEVHKDPSLHSQTFVKDSTDQGKLLKDAHDQKALIEHHLQIMTRSCQELLALGIDTRVLILNSGCVLSQESEVVRCLDRLLPQHGCKLPSPEDSTHVTSFPLKKTSPISNRGKHNSPISAQAKGRTSSKTTMATSSSHSSESYREEYSMRILPEDAVDMTETTPVQFLPQDGLNVKTEDHKRFYGQEVEQFKGADRPTASQCTDLPPLDQSGMVVPPATESTSTKNEAGRFCCEICGKLFTMKKNLSKHKSLHEPQHSYPCDECGRQFSSKTRLQQHKDRHRGTLPRQFMCDVCGRSFTEKANLKAHMRLHTGDKPYSCEFCGKCFAVPGPLKFHLATHTGHRPYKCDVCGKGFVQPARLRYHQITHSGEKPYKCQKCEKAYTSKYQLKVHQRLHADVKLYECSVCGKAMQTSHKLLVHMRLHTGEKPYSCQVCGEKFSRSDVLFQHSKKHRTEG